MELFIQKISSNLHNLKERITLDVKMKFKEDQIYLYYNPQDARIMIYAFYILINSLAIN